MTESNHRHGGKEETGPEWATPEYLWKPLSEALGGFDLDPASGAEPSAIADERFTVEDDGLAQDWHGDVWVNPPYGRSFNRDWAEKVYAESQRDEVDSITALISAAPSTQWWHNNYANGDAFTFVEGRVKFIGPDGTGNAASFPSVFVTFERDDGMPDEYYDAMDELGQVTVARNR